MLCDAIFAAVRDFVEKISLQVAMTCQTGATYSIVAHFALQFFIVIKCEQ